jgi:preprotein translocase subunit SecE
MKKKKTRRTKSSKKKPDLTPSSGIPQQREMGSTTIPQKEKEAVRPAPAKKDVQKRGESDVFLPKKFYIVAKQFLVDAKTELKKVTWPTRKELLSITAVVIILVLLVAFYLGIVDLGLVKIIRSVIG